MAKRKPDPLGPRMYQLLDGPEFAPGIDLDTDMTVKKAVVYVGRLYEVVKEGLGEETARKIFEPFGRALTDGDRRVGKAADLMWKYFMMQPKPNMRELARQVADQYGGFDNALTQIKRARKDADVLDRVEAESIKVCGYSILTRDIRFRDPDDDEIDAMSEAERKAWLRTLPRQTPEAQRRAAVRAVRRVKGRKR
jgi:hypothetical protein